MTSQEQCGDTMRFDSGFFPGFLMWGVDAHYRHPLGAILSPPHLNGYTDQEKKKKKKKSQESPSRGEGSTRSELPL